METKSISIKQIADRLKRHPLLSKLSFESIIDYTVDFFGIVGLPNTYQDRVRTLTIMNYRAQLPEDFVEMNQVRSNTTPPIYFRYTTDTFHMLVQNNQGGHTPIVSHSIEPTYKLQGGIIYTSIKEGKIEISYRAMEVDDCGLPVIPDNSKFLRALEAYIKLQYFTILFDEGKLQPAIFNNTQQEYCWAVGACESEFHNISLDKLESIANLAKSMLVRTNQHNTGYELSGDPEILRVR